MKQHIWAIAFSVCLVGFTAYLSLDTFAFATVYQENATEMNTSLFHETEASGSASLVAAASSDAEDDAAASDGKGSSEASDASGSPEPSSSGHSAKGGKHGGKHGKPSDAAGRRASSSSGSGADGTKEGSDASGDADASGGSDADDSSMDLGATLTDQADVDEVTDAARTYEDDNVSVTLSQYSVEGTAVYVADVTVSSAEYLKTAFANDTYGKNVTAATSEMATAHDAILAVNGDNYGSRERGYVIRNGVVYRDTPDDSDVLCVNADGSFSVVDPSTVSAQQLVEQGVWQAFSFGPALVQDGEVSVSTEDEVGKAKASNPRTAIGILGDNHYVFVVSDGRTDESEGLSLHELATFMQSQLGVECAYNLDGGGSSTMVFNGGVVNNPTSNGNHIAERNVNDIIYIG